LQNVRFSRTIICEPDLQLFHLMIKQTGGSPHDGYLHLQNTQGLRH